MGSCLEVHILTLLFDGLPRKLFCPVDKGFMTSLLIQHVQHHRSYPGEDWQLNFTQLPICKGFKHLLVFLDTFTGWIESLPTRTEKAQEDSKQLLKEILPRFSLSQSLQNDSGPSFTSHVTQQVAKALGIRNFLHSSWRPQSSGKIERAKQTLKNTLRKLCQETSGPWLKPPISSSVAGLNKPAGFPTAQSL